MSDDESLGPPDEAQGPGQPPAPPPEPRTPASPAPPVPAPAPNPEDAGGPPGDGALEDSFLTVWLHPRATIRRIVAADPSYAVVPLAAIGGISQVLASASRRDMPGLSLGGILLGAFAGGPLFGVFALYVGAWLVRLTGRWWLHGEARPEELRAAFGWGSLPHVVALPLWLLATAAFGLALYAESGFDLGARSPLYILFTLAVAVLQVWGLVIASAGVAEVQGYRSGWKGFWNILLALLLVLVVTVVVVLVVTLLLGMATGLFR